MNPLLAGIATSMAMAGVMLALVGLVGRTAQPNRPASTLSRRLSDASRIVAARHQRRRLLSAAAAGLLALVVTGWIVGAGAAVLAVLTLPRLLSGRTAGAARIARLEALEAWTRRLADVLAAHAGLEQALVTSVRTPPAAIADELRRLGGRLDAKWRTEDALRALADDLDDPTADFVAAALSLAASRRGARLARALTGLAETVADEVAMRRSVEADRAKPRTTARWITYITLVFVAIGVADRAYTEPFGTPEGQLVLTIAVAVFAGGFWWTWRLANTEPRGRFMTSAATP